MRPNFTYKLIFTDYLLSVAMKPTFTFKTYIHRLLLQEGHEANLLVHKIDGPLLALNRIIVIMFI